MKKMPLIVVELIYIEGPLKGEIQEFSSPEIVIGRHPSCQSQIPKELTIVSRQHARIVREGNRFRIVDQSTNGTFVNGKQITEAYLKDGDVIMLAEGGPKASFLTRIEEGEYQPPAPEVSAPAPPPPEPAPQAPAPPPQQPKKTTGPMVQKSQVPLVIQYGPTLQSFKALPITLGSGDICDFKLDHTDLANQHAQIFFHGDQYWIKDLTGSGGISVNGTPVDRQAPMGAEDVIRLSIGGPEFRFLGGGRLAEIEAPAPEPPSLEPPEQEVEQEPAVGDKKENTGHPLKKPGALFKKIFK